MPESIATRALRGLGNALRLNGDREAPRGIELAHAAQPVFDLTQFTRYGSALQFAHFADGWVTATFLQAIVASTNPVAVSLIWDTDVSGSFGISQNILAKTIFWIHGISLQATASAQLTDAGDARLSVNIPIGLDLNGTGGGRTAHDIWMGKGSDELIERTPLIASYIPLLSAYKMPFPWAAGQSATFLNQNDAAVGTVTYDWSILGRILPLGTPPI